MTPDDPAAQALYRQAEIILLQGIPLMAVWDARAVYPISTKYWVGWPKLPRPVPTDPPYYGEAYPTWETDTYDIWLNIRLISGPLQILYNLKTVKPIQKVIVWFTADVPFFMGADGKTYGPFVVGQFKEIPEDDANTLTTAGKASFNPPIPGLAAMQARLDSLQSSVTSLTQTIATLQTSVDSIPGIVSTVNMMTTLAVAEGVIIIIIALVLLMRKK